MARRDTGGESRRPRLLCLMHMPPPVHGVTMVNQQVAASEAIAAELELDVLPLRFAPSLDVLGRVSVRKLGRALATGARLAARLIARRPDALYLTISPHGGALYRDCAYAALARLASVPRIYHVHARGIAETLHGGWRQRLGAWVFDGAWLIHLAPSLVAETAELAGASGAARTLTVANGVPDRNPTGALARSGAAVPRVLFLSNLIPHKGPLLLVEAIAALHRRGIALDATLSGADDGRTAGALQAAIARHGLADRVRYVGPAFDAAKHALLASHDVFTLPTMRDSFPLVVLEAMQHGLPVVASTVGAIPDIVVDGSTGLLTPPGDVAALADRLARLAASPELRARLGAAGRARYCAEFTVEAFEARLVAALRRCISDDLGVRDPVLARDQPLGDA